VEQAGSRLEVVAAGTVRADHARKLVEDTGVRAVHLAASAPCTSAMEHRNRAARLGSASEDYDFAETDAERVRAVVQALSPGR
jgi:copper homeostasis protein CutC